MAKFHGSVGFIDETTETAPGVFEPQITEKAYIGDIIRNVKNWEAGEHLNDNVAISNRFSIVADTFTNQNIPNMRYVLWNGTKWKITNVESLPPRLILSVGGVYNG